MNKEKVKKIINISVSCLASLLFILALVIIIIGVSAYKNNKPTKIFGYIYSVVPTDSMEPVIKSGDFILSKEVEFSSLEIGDDIIYYSNEKNIYIVHRIVDINSNGEFVMKGINNLTIDSECVNSSNYVAKVVKVISLFKLGGLVASHRSLIFLVLMLVFLLVVVVEVCKMIIIIKEEKIAQEKEKLEKEKRKIIEEEKEKIKKELLEEIQNDKGKITER